MTKKIFLLAGIVILLLTLWLGSTVFFFVRTFSQAASARNALEARAATLITVLGPADGPPSPADIPYDLPGGQAGVLSYSNILEGRELQITCGISAPPGLPNAEGPYEVAIFTNASSGWRSTDWAPEVLRNISVYAKTTPINPGDTFNIADLTTLMPSAPTLLFVRYKSVTFDGKPGQILLGIAVTPGELEFAKKYGNADLIQKLKDNGLYPISYLNRSSIVDPSASLVTSFEGRKNRQKTDLNEPAKTAKRKASRNTTGAGAASTGTGAGATTGSGRSRSQPQPAQPADDEDEE